MMICIDVTLLVCGVIVLRSYQIALICILMLPQYLFEILKHYITASLCELKTADDCFSVIGTENHR